MSLGEDHILCVAWLNLMSSLHMQLLIIVIDICVVKINFKDIIHQKELSHVNIA